MIKTRPKTGKLRHQDGHIQEKGRKRPPGALQAVKKLLLPAVVFFWPVAYLFRNIFVINGQYSAITNDFLLLYYKYKLYLLANLADFRFPLWSPSEAAGFPLYTNPFAQVFYPLNVFLTASYKILDGYNALDHQVFTVIGVSIFSLGLFMWLKVINKNIRAVLFAVLVMSVSFKVTEILRFPNAVHTAAWYPWIFYAVTAIFLSKSLRAAAAYGVLLALSLICLCTGGYPYYIYYGLFLFVPYLMVFFIRPLRTRLISPESINWKRTLLTLAVAGIVAVVICSPYMLGIKQLMDQTADRGGKSFEYSTFHKFNLEDTVGSLVYPPAACTEGWYFFSITCVLIIAVYLFGRRFGAPAGEQQPGQDAASAGITSLFVKLFLIAWIGLIGYISYGQESILFVLLWKYMPGFASLRVWGRMNIILVPILAWLLSLAYGYFESLLFGRTDAGESGTEKRSIAFWPTITLAAAYAAILGIQLYMYYKGIFDFYWTEYFKELMPLRIKFITHGAVGFACVFAFMVLAKWVRPVLKRYPVMMVIILLAAVVFEIRHTGTRIWMEPRKWYPERYKLNIAQINELSFRYKRIDQEYSICLNPVFSAGIMHNWYFNRYVNFLKATENEIQARKVLLGVADGRRIFFSESIGHSTVESFLKDALTNRQAGRLLFYSGDELRWEVDAPKDGYLSFIDNWDYGWKAWVDEQPAQIELLFGTFKSVRLSVGKHTVRFLYKPGILPAFMQKSEYADSNSAIAK